MRVWHARRGRWLAVAAAVTGLHALAVGWAWRHAAPPAGLEPDGRVPAAVTASLVPPDVRPAAPASGMRPAAPPEPRTARPGPAVPAPSIAGAAPPGGAVGTTGLPETVPAAEATPADLPAAPDPLPTDEVPAAMARAETGAEPPVPDRLAASAAGPGHDTGPSPSAGVWHPPPPARLEYEVSGEARGLQYRASAVLDWQPAGERYRAELSVQAFLVGGRTQSSHGRLTTRGPQPETFRDRARRERVLHFEWPGPETPGRARTEVGVPIEPLPPGTQDRLTLFVQVGGMLDAAHAVPGQHWTVPVAGLGRLESWTFAVVGRERLALPAGVLEAVHLRRVGGEDGSTGVDLWFTPSVPGLPVRILLQQANGDRVDQRLRARGPATLP